MMRVSENVMTERDISTVLHCGICLITVSDGIKDNGCIINSAVQITSEPPRIVFSLTKRSYTHKLLMKTGEFNLSVLDRRVDMDLIEKFGNTNGRENPKFKDENGFARSENGILYPTGCANTVMCFENVALTDWDTHTCFTAKLKSMRVLSDIEGVSYNDYLIMKGSEK